MVATHPKGLTNLTCDSKHTGSTQTKTYPTWRKRTNTIKQLKPTWLQNIFLDLLLLLLQQNQKIPKSKNRFPPPQKKMDQYRFVNSAASLCMMYCTIYCRPSCKLSKHSWRVPAFFVAEIDRLHGTFFAPKNTRWGVTTKKSSGDIWILVVW